MAQTGYPYYKAHRGKGKWLKIANCYLRVNKYLLPCEVDNKANGDRVDNEGNEHNVAHSQVRKSHHAKAKFIRQW